MYCFFEIFISCNLRSFNTCHCTMQLSSWKHSVSCLTQFSIHHTGKFFCRNCYDGEKKIYHWIVCNSQWSILDSKISAIRLSCVLYASLLIMDLTKNVKDFISASTAFVSSNGKLLQNFLISVSCKSIKDWFEAFKVTFKYHYVNLFIVEPILVSPITLSHSTPSSL